MRLYVIPLLLSRLEQSNREINLYRNKIDYEVIGEESKKYFVEQLGKWQIIQSEIVEAINKLETI
jgi:hypothetical protein